MGITLDKIKEIIGETVEKKVLAEVKPYQDAMFEKLNKPVKNKMFGTFTDAEGTQDKANFGYNRKAKDMFGEGVDNGFSSLGEVLQAVKNNDHSKLQRLERDMVEGTGETGGFLLPSQFSNEIIDMMLEEEICRKRCKIYSIGKGKGNTLTIPALSDYDHSSNIAGVNTYWTGEGSDYTESTNVKIRQLVLKLNKLTCLVDISEELVEDSAVKTETLLSGIFAKALAFEIDSCVLTDSGTGAGKILSITNCDGVIEVAGESGQDSDTLNVYNVTNLISRIHPASFNKSIFLSSLSNLGELLRLNLPIGTGGTWYHAFNEVSGVWRLFSRPVIFTEHCAKLGDSGNLQLIDFSRYAMLIREGISVKSDTSLGFKSDMISFKASLRIDGQPLDTSSTILADGETTVSPFIKLATI
ncbi:phage major capsid protein [Candidatus Atribacteria bacterium 1244-E10-H5-B2]|nr:MAG: phage major capsid protein [Candidatus Atribacteria bacterium 1244-E10-H5-B2]